MARPLTHRVAEASGLDIGHYISGIGHLGLLGWVAFGSLFQLDPEPFEVREVVIVPAQEFDAMFAPQTPPETVADVAPLHSIDPQKVPPEVEVPVEVVDVNPEAPALARSSAPDSVRDNKNLSVLVDLKPVEMSPEPRLPTEQVAVLMPNVKEPSSSKRVAKKVPKIAPIPEVVPEPDVLIEKDITPANDINIAAETPDPPTEEAVTEEAVVETKIEEKEPPPTAPMRSLRPKLRPEIIAPTQADSVALALQEAMNAPDPAAPAEQNAPSGPPMTLGERDSLQLAVEACWQVDPGSLSANVVITLVMELTPDGKLVAGSLRMINSEGGNGAAVKTAFQKARGAVLRCKNKMGENLPPEKYEHWRQIEMRFDPSNMRTR